jgi:hypothetical protein
MKNKQRKVITSKLTEEQIQRWHLFSVQNRINKEEALGRMVEIASKTKLINK